MKRFTKTIACACSVGLLLSASPVAYADAIPTITVSADQISKIDASRTGIITVVKENPNSFDDHPAAPNQGRVFELKALDIDVTTVEGMTRLSKVTAENIGDIPVKGSQKQTMTSSGKLEFANLAVGAYVLHEQVPSGANLREYQPSQDQLILLPTKDKDSDAWAYNLTVYPKPADIPEETPPDTDIPLWPLLIPFLLRPPAPPAPPTPSPTPTPVPTPTPEPTPTPTPIKGIPKRPPLAVTGANSLLWWVLGAGLISLGFAAIVSRKRA